MVIRVVTARSSRPCWQILMKCAVPFVLSPTAWKVFVFLLCSLCSHNPRPCHTYIMQARPTVHSLSKGSVYLLTVLRQLRLRVTLEESRIRKLESCKVILLTSFLFYQSDTLFSSANEAPLQWAQVPLAPIISKCHNLKLLKEWRLPKAETESKELSQKEEWLRVRRIDLDTSILQ